MFKISPDKLLSTLEHIGKVNRVEVPEAIRADARIALDRFLDLAHRRVLPRKYETRFLINDKAAKRRKTHKKPN